MPYLLVVGPKGSVYASVLDAVYKLNPKTGALAWKSKLPNDYYPTVLATAQEDDTLYAAAWDYKAWMGNKGGVVSSGVYALDPESGNVKWILKTDAACQALVVGNDRTLYCGSTDHKISAMDPGNGSLKWRSTLPDEPVELVVGDGALYVGTWVRGNAAGIGSVYALDPGNGGVKWRFKAKGAFDALAVGITGPVYGWATVPADKAPGQIYALDPGNGRLEWTFTPAGGVNSLLVANGRAVYAGSGGVYALNPANGTVEWKFVSGKEFNGLVATNDGAIYTNSAGNIYALDPSNGAVRLKFAGLGIGAVGYHGNFYNWSDGSVYAVSPPSS